jgi:chromosome segregation ATPase
MTPRWKHTLVLIVLVVALGSAGAGPRASAKQAAPPAAAALTTTAAAPAQGQESRTTVQLLEEVRALRAAIERMTVSGTRAQLLLGRLQMQEQRMTTLGRQLQETRTNLATRLREREGHASEIERLTQGIERASTPDERAHLEMNLKAITQAVKQFDQQINVLQADDAGIAQALSTEQARWIDLNGRLEELEGLLATQKP